MADNISTSAPDFDMSDGPDPEAMAPEVDVPAPKNGNSDAGVLNVGKDMGKTGSVGDKASNVIEKIKSTSSWVQGNPGNMVIVGSIVAVIICIVVGYGMYWLITRALTKKLGFTVPQTKVPLRGTNITIGSGQGIPRPHNGKRLAFSFWIYVDNLEYFQGTYRHIFHRGNDLTGSSPFVFMDKSKNKIHIRFTNADDVSRGSKISPQKPYVSNNQYSEKDLIALDMLTHGITIDYIPLQRWVHVAIVVNEEIKRGAMYGYVDGELVKTVSSDEGIELTKSAGANAGKKDTLYYDFSKVKLDVQGDVIVGGSPSDITVGPGFDGLISKIQFFNYDLNAKDIYDVYLEGPIDSLLAKMGLPSYGVQSPIYRIA